VFDGVGQDGLTGLERLQNFEWAKEDKATREATAAEYAKNHRPASYTELNARADAALSPLVRSDTLGANTARKVNSKYIDLIKIGSDTKPEELRYQYDQAQKRTANGRNKKFNSGGVSAPIYELGSLHSMSYSSFREKVAVRTLGRVSAKTYTRGQRTIAGSMNFAIFQSHELMNFVRDGGHGGLELSHISLLDQLPKFNIMIMMKNEYGGASILHLFNVTIATESQQMSIDDLALMSSLSFYAEDIATIENAGNLFETSLSMLHPEDVARGSLKFVNAKGETNSFLDQIGGNDKNSSKIEGLLNRSRGLF
jgi:hypothetical protein